MPRAPRISLGGYVYHVLNRANRRHRIFDSDQDYWAFENVLVEARGRTSMRVCAYAVMPNHWHLVLWPREDGDLPEFMRWLTQTHTQRWNAHRGETGTGRLYQGRYKSFLVQDDRHFLTVCRYVEANPVRAGLVKRSADWSWGSAARRAAATPAAMALLSDWPVPRPPNWARYVDASPDGESVQRIRTSLRCSRPFGDKVWTAHIAAKFGLGPPAGEGV